MLAHRSLRIAAAATCVLLPALFEGRLL